MFVSICHGHIYRTIKNNILSEGSEGATDGTQASAYSYLVVDITKKNIPMFNLQLLHFTISQKLKLCQGDDKNGWVNCGIKKKGENSVICWYDDRSFAVEYENIICEMFKELWYCFLPRPNTNASYLSWKPRRNVSKRTGKSCQINAKSISVVCNKAVYCIKAWDSSTN